MDITLALVTVLSLALAAAMSVVAWRLTREERQRGEARAAARAAEAAGEAEEPGEPPSAPAEAWTAAPARRSRLAVAVALAVFVAGSAASLTVVFGEARRLDRRGAQARAANGATLELLSLSEAREADRVVVRGVIRNPASAAAIDRVAAVVMLIGENGAVLSRARARGRADARTRGRVAVRGRGDRRRRRRAVSHQLPVRRPHRAARRRARSGRDDARRESGK